MSFGNNDDNRIEQDLTFVQTSDETSISDHYENNGSHEKKRRC